MTQTQGLPFYRSYLLNKTISLSEVPDLSDSDLKMLNIETMEALEGARHDYNAIQNKQSDEAGPVYRRLKVAGYFQAAIKIELDQA
ncbi:MAG: hypothetical protein EBV86_12925 [Marivivens sp.]|nr:hypothetical protein [Marivivens sp.]NBT52370.1 hypothetical protein [Marivivens sp.]NCW69440.1 hypothetical protein [Marivivens sp.]